MTLIRLLGLALVFIPGLSLAAGDPFLAGTNVIDWQCGAGFCAYGHDIGTNGWGLRHLPGYQNSVTFRPEVWEQVFTDLEKSGANFVRVPLMTEGQGILYKANDEILGADPQWIANTRTILKLAAAHQLRVEIGLLTGNTPKHKTLLNFFHAKRAILKDKKTMDDYLALVVQPLLRVIADESALWAVDVFGEADGALTEHPGDVSDADVRNFVARSLVAIRKVAPTLKLTASTGYWLHVTPKSMLELLAATSIDFYEVHLYLNDGNIFACDKAKNGEPTWRDMGRPVLLGEFGLAQSPPVDSALPLTEERQIAAAEARTTEAFFENAQRCGFIGAASWVANAKTADRKARDEYHNFYGLDGQPKPELVRALRKVRPKPF